MENSCRILGVDDDPRGVELMKRALLSLGEVGKAEGGETAFHLRFPLRPRADE